jgi:methylphosphotriester-DNA--protein-cysteine methyltransferase
MIDGSKSRIFINDSAMYIRAAVCATRAPGNVNTKKFHLPSCRSLPDEKNRVLFATREGAALAEYEPCGICKP